MEKLELLSSPKAPRPGRMTVTLVGSGVSTAVPVIGHFGTGCACADAIANPRGPNCRNNVSLLITVPANIISNGAGNETSAVERNDEGYDNFPSTTNTIDGVPVRFVLIDCGKTFRNAYFRVLVPFNVQLVDALLLTHDHADAIAGLDDLRDLQGMHMADGDWIIDTYVPTFLSEHTLGSLKRSVGYIVDNSQQLGRAPSTAEGHAALVTKAVEEAKATKGDDKWNNIGIRRSTALQFLTLPEDVPARFHVPALGADFPMYSLPVEHGKGYISLGFVFGHGTALKSAGATEASVAGRGCVVYISDVSAVPEASLRFLLDLVKIDVLYVDMLHNSIRSNPVHYCRDDAVALITRVKPKHAYTIGMYCDVKHTAGSEDLAAILAQKVDAGALTEGEVLGMSLGFDGMSIELPQ